MNIKKNKVITIVIIISFLYINRFSAVSGNITSDKNIIETDISQNAASSVFKVINFNLLEGGKNDGWKEIIVAENADILLLSETGRWSSDDGSLEAAVAEVNQLFPDEKPYSARTFIPDSVTDGQAVFSRFPIIDSVVLDTIILDDGSTWNINHAVIDVSIDVYGVVIHFIVIHFTCCDGGLSSRLKEMEGILNYIDTLGDVPIMYAGDFNSDSPQDVGDLAPPVSSLGPEPIEILLDNEHPKASNNHTFIDVYRTLRPYDPGYTYIDSTFQSRLDYIFVNEPLMDTLINSTVLDFYPAASYASDHFAVNAYFNMDYQNTDLRPPTPLGLISATVSETETVLSWSNGTDDDIALFNIYRNGTFLSSIKVDSTTFTDNVNYLANSIYQYSVTISDLNGNESPVSIPLYINSSYGVLSKPSEVKLEITTEIPEKLHLKWTVGNTGGLPIIEYVVSRSITSDGVFVFHTITTEPELIDYKVRVGLGIYYRVKARNAIGFSDLSNIASGIAVASPVNTTDPSSSGISNNETTPVNITYSFIILPFAMIYQRRKYKK